MTNFVFNIAKGRIAELHNRVINDDPVGCVLTVVSVASTGIETDAVLMDKATLAAVFAGSTNEATNTGYSRQQYSAINIGPVTPDNTNNLMEVAIADAAWFGVATLGGAWAKILLCYSPSGASPDSALVPLVALGVSIIPNGGDITVEFDDAGYFRAS